MMNRLLLTLLSLSLLPTTSFGAVNMKDASYYKTWIDLEVPSEKSLFQLRRSYNSRSLHDGLWGFGWCSDIEKSLDLSRQDQVSFRDCRQGAPTVYRRNNKGLYESSDQDLIEFQKPYFVRTLKDKTRQKFNSLGRLVQLLTPDGQILEISYDSRGLPQELTLNSVNVLRLEYDPLQKHVQKILKDRTTLTYRYEGRNLVQVQNAWGSRYYYSYDDYHNLQLIHYPDDTRERITYDTEKDWVVHIQTRDQCLENFRFQLLTTVHKAYRATAEKRCHGKLLARNTYEFHHRTGSEGTFSLVTPKISQNQTGL